MATNSTRTHTCGNFCFIHVCTCACVCECACARACLRVRGRPQKHMPLLLLVPSPLRSQVSSAVKAADRSGSNKRKQRKEQQPSGEGYTAAAAAAATAAEATLYAGGVHALVFTQCQHAATAAATAVCCLCNVTKFMFAVAPTTVPGAIRYLYSSSSGGGGSSSVCTCMHVRVLKGVSVIWCLKAVAFCAGITPKPWISPCYFRFVCLLIEEIKHRTGAHQHTHRPAAGSE